ncbi:hypothetical protein FDA94_00415 [Herbidospora galbida]|uniref:Uncharacterized protein n=1 Tax=Herbidospora galbida TaxID=2575442 RepID=A0A4U3MR96_9ACTN|nr:hypothetical protein [Herbidospora galbida]TKK91314.1 hypothetical protein FDA94_00415 [Herbidospora galbida]
MVTPPRRELHGGASPAWLLTQAARLSWEVTSILQLINGMRLNLSDELLDAAHATAIVESRLPLAPAWGNGPPRRRSIFAQAREAGTDPSAAYVDVMMIRRPPIDRRFNDDIAAASRPPASPVRRHHPEAPALH